MGGRRESKYLIPLEAGERRLFYFAPSPPPLFQSLQKPILQLATNHGAPVKGDSSTINVGSRPTRQKQAGPGNVLRSPDPLQRDRTFNFRLEVFENGRHHYPGDISAGRLPEIGGGWVELLLLSKGPQAMALDLVKLLAMTVVLPPLKKSPWAHRRDIAFAQMAGKDFGQMMQASFTR